MVIQVVVTVIITGQEAGVTSYIECSAREYSRTSIISDSDISPSNTQGRLNEAPSSRKKLSRHEIARILSAMTG